MQNMNITILQQYSFGNITWLDKLNLSNNKIAYLQRNIFHRTTLYLLDISRNKIVALKHDLISYLQNIPHIVSSTPIICCMLQMQSKCQYVPNCVKNVKLLNYTQRILLSLLAFGSLLVFAFLYSRYSKSFDQRFNYTMTDVFVFMQMVNLSLMDMSF